jgi:hypothetical protein
MAGKPVSRAAWNHTQSDIGMYDSRRHLIDRAIASDGNYDIHISTLNSVSGNFTRVSYMLGIFYMQIVFFLINMFLDKFRQIAFFPYTRPGVYNKQYVLFIFQSQISHFDYVVQM